ncbi:VOC family protein [Nitrospirillum bahiense]|uniref:Catechol 2,3-dioxygenase-like lactoylglutathione lyase family enzyme n=1 Tax=Nitrospirillum amazonense TaxID=28077 RepID=A0A560FC42_9PROT|nr:VOC family protein [Nitrospirillum amazonense]TWB19184.1 catechol 2,3-dioxygenase-like lactoylglutathione lyase family enzyme [Nitrospirillum amazonense]
MKFINAFLVAGLLATGAPAHAQDVKVAGIDHVGITVPDLQQAEEFFSSTFGCVPVTHIGPFPMATSLSPDRKQTVAPRATSLSLAMLRCGTGSNIELFAYKDSTGSTIIPNNEDLGQSHIAFYTDDVKAGAAKLKAKGLQIIGEPITMPSGDTAGETWVHFLSPWGSEMELVGYPNGKGYEKTAKVKLWSAKHPAD